LNVDDKNKKYYTKNKVSMLNYQRHEDVWGRGGIAPRILKLVTRRGEWSASLPGPFTHGEIVPGTRLTGSWVDPEGGLDEVAKNCPCD
jgi:hypothetical protein